MNAMEHGSGYREDRPVKVRVLAGDGRAEDLPRLLFERPAMTAGAILQPITEVIAYVRNQKLCHGASLHSGS